MQAVQKGGKTFSLTSDSTHVLLGVISALWRAEIKFCFL